MMIRNLLAGKARDVGPVIRDEEVIVLQYPLNMKGTAF